MGLDVRSAGLLLTVCLAACAPAPEGVRTRLDGSFVLAPAVEVLAGGSGRGGPSPGPSTGPAAPAAPAAPGGPDPGRPQPAAPAVGGGGTSGGGGTGVSPSVQGHVYGLAAAGDRPLPGATVRTTDGRSAVSTADGSFSLPGAFPADGVLIAARDGYVAAVAGGLDAAQSPALRLEPVDGVPEEAPRLDPRPIPIGGRILGPNGAPVAGALVVVADARGALAEAATSEADGSFRTTVEAPAARVVGGTVLAALPGPSPALGVLTGVQLDPVNRRVPDLQLVAASHALHAQVDDTPLGLPATASVTMVAADGTRLGLGAIADGVAVVALPGVRYDLRAEANSPEAGLRGVVAFEGLDIDYAQPETTVQGAFLAAPALTGAPSPGGTVAYAAVTGAAGYQVRLVGQAGQGFIWQGATPAISLPWPDLGALASGPYGLSLLAWSGSAPTVRTLAATTAGQLLTGAATYRWSSRRVDFTR